MQRRLIFHEVLVGILGSRNVYFQPPEGFKMAYPCIVYNRKNIRTNFADNLPYLMQDQYSVTVIEKDPESDIPDKIAKQSTATFERSFTSAGLNHNIFNVYF